MKLSFVENNTSVKDDAYPPMRLVDLTTMLKAADDEQLAADIDPAELVDQLAKKIDSIQELIVHWQGKAAAEETLEKKHAAKRQAWLNKIERMKSYVIYAMESGGFEVCPGQSFRARIKHSERTEMLEEPSARHLSKYHEYVTVSYRWNLPKVKKGLSEGKVPDSLAKVTRHKSLVID